MDGLFDYIPDPAPVSAPASLSGSHHENILTPHTFSFTAGEAQVFRLRERDPLTSAPITVSRHADMYRYVTEGGRQGPWSTDFAAYTREPMDVWTLPWVREIILCWGPQSSKTQVALNCIHYAIDQDPGPIIWVAPDENKTKDAKTKKIDKMIEKSPRLRELLSPASRDRTNRAIRFTNGASIQMAWAGSAAQLASDSYKYGIEDETEKYPPFAGREADPDALIDQRFTAFPYTYKKLKCSTPALETGIIWRAMTEDADEIRDYEARCPICGAYQVMRFENITWPSDIQDPRLIQRKRLAWYSCIECGMKWDERLRDDAVRFGRWTPRIPVPDGRPAVIAYHLPRWYSPFVTFGKCVAAHLRARDDDSKMMVFVTQYKAEAYSPTVADKQESEVNLLRIATLPPRTVPEDAITLTVGIDSHKTNYRFVVRAWAADLTSWLVDYGELSARSLSDVEELVFSMTYPIQNRDGERMGIWRAAIDTGMGVGRALNEEDLSRVDEIYAWLRRHTHRQVVFGVKGSSHRQFKRIKLSTVDTLPHSSKPIPGGLELRLLDTDAFKATIHSRLDKTITFAKTASSGEDTKQDLKQRFYLHSEAGEDYIRELLGEILKKKPGGMMWIKIRANHYLDCEVYAAACVDPEWFPSFQIIAAQTKMGSRLRHINAPTPPGEAPCPSAPEQTVAQDEQLSFVRRPFLEFQRPAWLNR